MEVKSENPIGDQIFKMHKRTDVIVSFSSSISCMVEIEKDRWEPNSAVNCVLLSELLRCSRRYLEIYNNNDNSIGFRQ